MSATRQIAVRTFTMADQHHFAAFSGDINPLHMDKVAARKTQAGTPAVHGVNGVLWALETYLAQADVAPAGFAARFERFVLVDTPVELVEVRRRAKVALELRVGDKRLTLITLHSDDDPPVTVSRTETAGSAAPIPATARELSFEEATQARGTIALVQAARSGLPVLDRLFGQATVQGLAGLSTLVGMIAPGLHSILSTIEVSFTDEDRSGATLAYEAISSHEAFSLVELAAAGPGLDAMIGAFRRPPPVAQPSFEALRGAVAPNIFRDVRALVIGGSRGLGEVTAKLIGAGGGELCITYAAGREDAERVAEEMAAAGARCTVLPFDATAAVAPQFAALPFRPTQIYYFATPRIFRQRYAFFSPALFEEYNAVYVTAFEEICRSFAGGTAVRVFYPSSVAVAERPRDLTEYAMSKAASEILCADIDRDMPGVEVIMERLPRLDTDQTATLTRVDSSSAAAVMARIVTRMAE